MELELEKFKFDPISTNLRSYECWSTWTSKNQSPNELHIWFWYCYWTVCVGKSENFNVKNKLRRSKLFQHFFSVVKYTIPLFKVFEIKQTARLFLKTLTMTQIARFWLFIIKRNAQSHNRSKKFPEFWVSSMKIRIHFKIFIFLGQSSKNPCRISLWDFWDLCWILRRHEILQSKHKINENYQYEKYFELFSTS